MCSEKRRRRTEVQHDRIRTTFQWGDDLSRTIRFGDWHRIIRREDELTDDHPLRPFVSAAKKLRSADVGDNRNRCIRLILGAREHLKESIRGRASENPYYFFALRWLMTIEAKLRDIQSEMAIPDVFVVGQPLDPLNPDELELFRTRKDLIGIIDHDLDDNKRGVLLLTGQRRMGKTSLLRMLPTYLGDDTLVVSFNFQRISGSDPEFKKHPHRYVIHNVSKELRSLEESTPKLPTNEVTEAWGTALAWLLDLDMSLTNVGRRILIAIDEIEALQRGINEGWVDDLTFLDFLRAAGDSLRRIRILVVSAHPLSSPHLGASWSDRLISVLPRFLGPLTAEAAEQLLRKPVGYFPDSVFDDQSVLKILSQTGTHPYLIQVVGDQIVKQLNAEHRTVATPRDIDLALDNAAQETQGLFGYLWSSFEPPEARLMRALAHGAPVDLQEPAFHSLRAQCFIEIMDGAPRFVFPLFGRWIRDYQ